ncbi:uncharacterized protein F4807DRAFT_472988 [Annulohypoxylon truncatum]|uniref:uncharacterized protein n=1 Tax=Annulohypoxylon truncatum TaxID=327061 RepID=UPI002008324B|nr:uncharacterized protein F4807DRAFT_472988 [Annulohypoxylon truncatum]KAI1211534.1 hypothetical protein F4807DRAFT_472988 [Annulohypoxylon truncatum]
MDIGNTQSLVDPVNKKLKGHFERDRQSDYDCVEVMLIYWEKSDNKGFMEEAEELKKLFRDKFNYPVTLFAIPSDNSHLALDTALGNFLRTLIRPRSLGIIHYGGHGDSDLEGKRERRSVWASHGDIGVADERFVTWSDIQPKLRHVEADILLLLDCCFAAQTARITDRIIPENVELLAACAMNLTTPGPDWASQTFTKGFIKEVEHTLGHQKPIVIKEIHHRLSKGDRKLIQTPIHFSMAKNKSIRLDPIQTQSTHTIVTPQAFLTLQMALSCAPSERLLNDITSWLMVDAPRDISGIEVTDLVERALRLRNYVGQHSHHENSVLQMANLQEESQVEISGAWDGFLYRLGSSLQTMVIQFLKDFNDNIATVQKVVERNILLAPQLFDEEILEMSIGDPAMGDMGLAEALAVRLTECVKVVPRPTVMGQTLEVSSTGLGNVFQTLSLENHSDLGRILVEPDESHSRYGMIFANPRPLGPDPVTLYNILQSHNTRERRKDYPRPSLGQRFVLALTIGQALMQWHMAGWVHQGIASYNALLFRDQSGGVDYELPYLFGFGYTREYDYTSLIPTQPGRGTTVYDVYKHPDRQGYPPLKSHTRYHDIYSFGLLLVEIALWTPIEDSFKSTINLKGPSKIREEALKKVKGVIRHEMGLAYETATLVCLEGDFGIEQDDPTGSKLTRRFEQRVIERLEVGKNIDRVNFPLY